jgi:hypothetical protein
MLPNATAFEGCCAEEVPPKSGCGVVEALLPKSGAPDDGALLPNKDELDILAGA